LAPRQLPANWRMLSIYCRSCFERVRRREIPRRYERPRRALAIVASGSTIPAGSSMNAPSKHNRAFRADGRPGSAPPAWRGLQPHPAFPFREPFRVPASSERDVGSSEKATWEYLAQAARCKVRLTEVAPSAGALLRRKNSRRECP
jgi:hypothetical protein